MLRDWFFLACVCLAGSAAAVPTTDREAMDQITAFQAAMDEGMAEVMRPGPKQEGWNKGGIDLHAMVEAAPGGTTGNFLLSVDKDGERSVMIVGGRDVPSLIPRGWKAGLQAGSSRAPIEADHITIARLDGPFYVIAWEKRRRNGDAYCSAGSMGAELYESSDPTEAGEIPRAFIPALFQATVTHIEKHSICWRYDRVRDGFKVAYFLEDGRTLPELNNLDERTTIVPTAPVGEVLKRVKPVK